MHQRHTRRTDEQTDRHCYIWQYCTLHACMHAQGDKKLMNPKLIKLSLNKKHQNLIKLTGLCLVRNLKPDSHYHVPHHNATQRSAKIFTQAN